MNPLNKDQNGLNCQGLDFRSLISQTFSDTNHMIQQLSALLPNQGPIKDFIHHNTLHSFQGLPFGEALVEAGQLFGADISMLAGDPHPRESKQGLKNGGIREQRATASGYDVDKELEPLMIRLTAGFYDQGLAIYSMPIRDSASTNLFVAVAQLCRESLLPIHPLHRPIAKKMLALSSIDCINECLKLLTALPMQARYLAEVLLTLPGWAGFVHTCEHYPSLLIEKRSSKLVDWIALFLCTEVAWLNWRAPHTLGDSMKSQQMLVKTPDGTHRKHLGDSIEQKLRLREWAIYSPLLSYTKEKRGSPEGTSGSTISTQVITCIDDREFSFRHFLEKSDSTIATYGAPGFFAVDCVIQEGKHGDPVKHCPVPINPKHTLQVFHHKRNPRAGAWQNETKSLVRGLLITQLAGIPAGFKLMLGLFSPKLVEKRRIDFQKKIFLMQVITSGDKTDEAGRQLGYTVDQAAMRVLGLLKTIGLSSNFAALIAVIGHGASSVNNPYFAAYDCGACSGRPGALNAYAFCAMANDSKVRVRLQSLGINLPDETTFVPFIHDTTADRIDIVGVHDFSESTNQRLVHFQSKMDSALGRNAQFRCRQFNLAKSITSPDRALKHVGIRSVAWYEPRPEYNHATNVACVVGRRNLTAGMHLDRAVFLQSYDPSTDSNAQLLSGILGAVIPVCGGINLEYFFSRLDGEVYGAGSKLPQNVSGLIGVMTGLESDLRTGLPLQMTEIHDPLRLLILVEQKPELILRALESIPHLHDWINHRWVWLVSQDPSSGAQLVYDSGKFVKNGASEVANG